MSLGKNMIGFLVYKYLGHIYFNIDKINEKVHCLFYVIDWLELNQINNCMIKVLMFVWFII